VPAYPFYNPGPSWDGSLPNGYNASQYYINTGAMWYTAGSYDCSRLFPALSGWAFASPTNQYTYVSACDMTSDLATLINDMALWAYAHGLPGHNQVYFGPNDCWGHIGGNLSGADTALSDVLAIATQYSQTKDNGDIEFTAEVDDEGYRSDDCDLTSESVCSGADVTFFLGYPGAIGPAGALPCGQYSDDEKTLSLDGGGPALPQVYVYTGAYSFDQPNSCQIGHQPPGTWPYTIPSGYAGILTDPDGGYYTSWEANIRWSLCHGVAPAFDFDWSYPGGRG
jgi:hypothetical protein